MAVQSAQPAPPLSHSCVPTHVAIIMDGNGRWARQRGLPRMAGHRAGTENIRQVIERFADYGVKYLTLYAFSTENWTRPRLEVQGLMRILSRVIKRETKHFHENGIRLLHLGNLDGLSPKLQREVLDAIELTKDNDRMAVCIAFNYGGRAEIVDAVRRLMADGMRPEDVDEDVFSSHLYTANLPDPDLIIRTAGEMRVSNFLLWQGAYAEFYSTTVYWPDFDSEDIDQALLAYSQRKRRFGGLAPEDDERSASRRRPSQHSPKR
ncbi:MAG: polyprenyl diphosphate synthase [Chloroflexota bacterium]|nr:polyprenyl diphosphate synthase [Chloroflexota bacterium]